MQQQRVGTGFFAVLADVWESALEEQRLLTTLLLALACTALVVAAIGIHGLIAASLTERTREMGIRLALGATVAKRCASLALPGIVARRRGNRRRSVGQPSPPFP